MWRTVKLITKEEFISCEISFIFNYKKGVCLRYSKQRLYNDYIYIEIRERWDYKHSYDYCSYAIREKDIEGAINWFVFGRTLKKINKIKQIKQKLNEQHTN